jgi:hypothetical protein
MQCMFTLKEKGKRAPHACVHVAGVPVPPTSTPTRRTTLSSRTGAKSNSGSGADSAPSATAEELSMPPSASAPAARTIVKSSPVYCSVLRLSQPPMNFCGGVSCSAPAGSHAYYVGSPSAHPVDEDVGHSRVVR